MKGLLMKDLLNLKKEGKVFPLIIGLYVVLSVIVDDPSFFLGFIVLISAMMVVTTITYDERSKWDKYALTMPVTRKQLVLSKYVFGVASLSLGVLLCLILQLAKSVVGGMELDASLLVSLAVLLSTGLLFISLVLPFIYKLGVEKGRYVYMAFMIMLLIPLTGLSDSTFEPLMELEPVLPLVLPAAAIVLTLLSMLLSIKIVERKSYA